MQSFISNLLFFENSEKSCLGLVRYCTDSQFVVFPIFATFRGICLDDDAQKINFLEGDRKFVLQKSLIGPRDLISDVKHHGECRET